ncbi:MAG: FAD:protein FMN transferase [Tetrasphaera sp.]|nr:FAD:protein FMN transferase [Tetrasphaera sp.]
MSGRAAWVEHIMGMPISIHVRGSQPRGEAVTAAVRSVFGHLRKVDAVLSTWRADSDLLRLQHAEVAPGSEDVHDWIAEVTSLCLQAEERTDGLFAAWRVLDSGRIAFDPTGVVKGWAVASASAYLAEVPDIAWSIGAGGDILCGAGRLLGGQAPVWRIGIQDPADAGRCVDVVGVAVGAVATSGNAIRGTHVRDPRTGGVVDRAGSATVVGPDLVWADVWATAAWVDPQRCARLLAERDPAYRLITVAA